MILDASYETEPSFGQDPCVDDLLEDILQSGLNKTHLHFFKILVDDPNLRVVRSVW